MKSSMRKSCARAYSRMARRWLRTSCCGVDLDDLADAAPRDRLKWAFSDPERLRPRETRQSLTERVAASFASVAQALRERGHHAPPPFLPEDADTRRSAPPVASTVPTIQRMSRVSRFATSVRSPPTCVESAC